MKTMTLTREDGKTLEVVVQPMRVRDYKAAFAAWEAEDEAKILALCCHPAADPVPGDPVLQADWPLTLTPDSYAEAWEATMDALSGFFGYSGRRSMAKSMRDPAALRSMLTGGSPGPSTLPNSGHRRT